MRGTLHILKQQTINLHGSKAMLATKGLKLCCIPSAMLLYSPNLNLEYSRRNISDARS